MFDWLKGKKEKKTPNTPSVVKKPTYPLPLLRVMQKYELPPVNYTPPSQQRLAAVWLMVGDHLTQLVTSEHHMVDLYALERQVSAPIKSISYRKLKALFERSEVGYPLPLPIYRGLVTWVDALLLEQDVVYLDATGKRDWVPLSKERFLELHQTSTVHPGLFTDHAEFVLLQKHQSDNTISLSERLMKQRILRLDDLPPLNESSRNILALRNDVTSNAEDLVRVVEQDPTLTALVLKLASSALYGQSNDDLTLHTAITRVLGFDTAINLLLGVSFAHTLKSRQRAVETLLQYWPEALITAQLMKALAKELKQSDLEPDVAYLIGLLGNFGYQVITYIYPDKLDDLYREWNINRHVSPGFLDYVLLGASREQVSSAVLEHWGLPNLLCQALLHQNDTDYDGLGHQYARLLSAARKLMVEKGFYWYTPVCDRNNPLALTPEIIDKVLKQLPNVLKEVKGLHRYLDLDET